MREFGGYKLGETNELIDIDTAEHHRLVALQMARQGRSTIHIISRKLDPGIYDTTDFIDAIRAFALQNRRARVRIMVYTPREIVRRGHRLIDVATRLSSFFQIRTPGREFKHFNESLFIADKTAYIHRPFSERYEASVNFNDKRTCKYLLVQFEDMWEKATPDLNLNRYHL